jgi:H+/Cl- antiporter ClcA
MGAGIGAIFGAPLGGAILAAEILYKDDLENARLFKRGQRRYLVASLNIGVQWIGFPS